MDTFVAIDFETADNDRDSACAVGLVRVEAGRVSKTLYRLIQPPRRHMPHESIHGIGWEQVANEPTFESVGKELIDFVAGAQFFAAHSAGFDRGVLEACCKRYSITIPNIPFVCTVKLARAVWNVRPTRLPDVCDFLNITLEHHQAMSDANACAEIVMSAAHQCSPLDIARLGSRKTIK